MGKRPLPVTHARGPLIRRACAKTWPGTADVVAAVVAESVNHRAWQPVRAAALMVTEANPDGHVWMTAAEFEACSRPYRMAEVAAQTGVTQWRRRAILAGDPVRKVEALAFAHWTAGLPLPVPAGEVEAFAAWVERCFGLTAPVTRALGLRDRDHILDRVRGYTMRSGRRSPRQPEAGLIRAMDWCHRIGPISPYGDRLGPVPFPKAGPP